VQEIFKKAFVNFENAAIFWSECDNICLFSAFLSRLQKKIC
jgi:hypothetical protein